MSNLRMAVVGTGHLGRIHAILAANLPGVKLVAVVDPDTDRCQQVASEFGAQPLSHHSQLVGHADAAIVAAPNSAHATIGCDLLSAGLHVLMEKPLARTVDECNALIAAAKKTDRTLQVGHVERFNPAFEAALPSIESPKYIESRRTSGYPARSTDIGVVLDLMIHDLDLVISLANSPLRTVNALGASVLGGHEDMAQARLQFENGCVADLVASRVSYGSCRTMNVYARTGFAELDFQQRTACVVTPSQQIMEGELVNCQRTAAEQAEASEQLYSSLLQKSQLSVAESNAIAEEQVDFATAIRSGTMPRVTGAAGRDAVAAAEMILASIEEHQWNGQAAGPIGPHAVPQTPILTRHQWATESPQRRAG